MRRPYFGGSDETNATPRLSQQRNALSSGPLRGHPEVAAEHEAHAAEHPALLDVVAVGELAADAVG